VKPIFLHHFAFDQMALDNLFQHIFIGGMVPHPVWPDDGNWPRSADLQAIGLGSLDARTSGGFGAVKAQFPETLFEIVP